MPKAYKVASTSLQFRLENLSLVLRSLIEDFSNSLQPFIARIKTGLSNLQNNRYHYRRSQSFSWGKAVVAAVTIVIVVLAGRALVRAVASRTPFNQKTDVAAPYKTIKLNREFSYPVKNPDGGETDMKILFTIEKLELAKEIVAKGQRATAISGRSFLLLTIKLTNNEDVGIEIDTRDYVRLSVDGSEEKLAADIHNDPVESQPLSTKTTRIGFPVNATIKKVTLYIGEIKGEKEAISIDL